MIESRDAAAHRHLGGPIALHRYTLGPCLDLLTE